MQCYNLKDKSTPYLVNKNLRLINAADRFDMFRHLFAGPAQYDISLAGSRSVIDMWAYAAVVNIIIQTKWQ